ncbi:MAG: glycosyltransferase family 2 protein [Leptospiraceae bacterium]|nr:glycosyltransferase family 2 protein [Leptospiraceae bacterium]
MFTLILPTYNEKENLKEFLPKLEVLFNSKNTLYEIIIVDDDSPDHTWQWAQEYSLKNSRIRVIRRITEKGLSSAVVTGMASSKGNTIGVMDADMQHDESILPKMIDLLKENDLVIGSRRTFDGSYGEMNWYRRILSYGATILAKLILPINTNDPMSGFFVLRRNIFEDSKDRINPRGYKILLELLAINPKMKIAEVGYSFRRREYGETKLSGSVMQQYIIALIDLRLGRILSWTFIKYGVTGCLGVFINLFGQFIFNQYFSNTHQRNIKENMLLPSTAVAFGFELSVISNFFLNNFWTFKDRSKKDFKNGLTALLKFNSISLIGFIIQYSCWFFLLQVFLEYFPIFFSEFSTYIANLIGILIATVTNYKLNNSYTWSEK